MDNNVSTKHYGFAQVPRQVLRGEKYRSKLSLAEKGLYACLKDICGEIGECYYSLRKLASEIGTSASTLTRFIPQLRDQGLIYAEKKIRGTGENKHEIWHIRIVDIWKENDALYRPQDCFNLKQNHDDSVSDGNNVSDASTSVSDRNENGDSVSNCNNTVSDRNKDCFNLLAKEYLNTNDNQSNNRDIIITDQPTPSTFVANATIPSVSSSEKLEQESSHIVIEATNENVEPKTTRNHQSLEQNPLFDAAPKSPIMPLESAKWCAETVVQIVEFRRNKRFLEDARGKNQKSQRERQLDAAKKIIDAKITREEFIKAYDARNDAWWQDNRGDLTVVDMAAKTTKGVMRTLEVLENIDSKKGVKTQSNGRQAQPSQCNSILTQEEKDFRKWLVSQPKEERPKILKARREARLAAQAQA